MSAEEVLFHGQELTTVAGEKLVVNPWGIKTGRKMMGRIKTIMMLFRTISGGEMGLEELLETSYDELVSIAGDSVGVPHTEFMDEKRFLLEDLIAILSTVIEVNFTNRPEFVVKMTTLFGLLSKMTGREDDPEETTEEKDSPESLSS